MSLCLLALKKKNNQNIIYSVKSGQYDDRWADVVQLDRLSRSRKY